MNLRTLRDVAAGDELTHSYLDLTATTSERQRELGARYGFVCHCVRCSDGHSVDECMEAGPSTEEARKVVRDAQEAIELARSRADAGGTDSGNKRLHEAIAAIRGECGELSVLRFKGERAARAAAAALGDNMLELQSAHAMSSFLEHSLGHLPAHPTLSMHRQELSTLEAEYNDISTAMVLMQKCVWALGVSHGPKHRIYREAVAWLEELREA